MNDTEVFLKIAESERDQYIHASKAAFKLPSISFMNKTPGSKAYARDSDSKEINCSLEKSTWRIHVFDAAETDASAVNDLRAGDVVYFHDPDSKMTLHMHDPHTMTRAEHTTGDHVNFDAFFRAHND